MALSSSTVWEVRSTGAATNGGGFVVGASGTDHSQQDAAQYSVTDGVTDGTTTITSATANFGTDVVGNIMYVQGGTGSITAGWYQITVRNSASSVTVDRSTGLTAGTGVTMKIGGALASLVTLGPLMVASNRAFIKAGSGYTQTASAVFTTSNTPSNTEPYTRLIGYTTTRGDGGRAVITLSTNTGLVGINSSAGNSLFIENLEVNCAGLGTSTGIYGGAYYVYLRNCKVSNFTAYGIRLAAGGERSLIDFCEVTGGTSAATAGIAIGSVVTSVTRCWVHDNACPGVISTVSGAGTVVAFNLITNNSGASSDGLNAPDTGMNIIHNTIYASGRDGIRVHTSYVTLNVTVRNNLLINNGGYGVNAPSAGFPATPLLDGNAYFNNTSGARNGIDSTAGILGVGAYTNVFDVILTGDPFTNAAGNVFTLNTTAGAGAAVRAAGLPGAFPGGLTTGYLDMGAAQHADPAAGGGGAGIFTSPVIQVMDR